ncbi:YceI family protein [Pontibacter ramchanderi]|uniref:YceI-like domain-containing protein n=1 Tax=Pontibacter ramchanderi TaxID=1179743 RepID=A0A2N3V0T6_9BACT|nr:YceI family protein [Pontibacter ramchanderi]PKV75234.1 YceI-like domain-containing protein [Pontibacter ramchanderi]
MKATVVGALYLVMFLLGMARLTVAMAQQSPRLAKAGSTIGYTLVHPLHIVQGSSQEVQSQLELSDTGERLVRVHVSVPVRSFDSGNRARDRDMLKVTEADKYPDVTFVSSEIVSSDAALTVTGLLTFHGVTQELSFVAQQSRQGENLLVEGGFDISLDAFRIRRPSILSMKVKDKLQVQFRMIY